jgi:SLT domain-containing protein
MAELSPAAQAQAVLWAGLGLDSDRLVIAAALRAAADQPYDVPVWIQGDAYWAYRNGVDAERERYLAIAAELDPDNSTFQEH